MQNRANRANNIAQVNIPPNVMFVLKPAVDKLSLDQVKAIQREIESCLVPLNEMEEKITSVNRIMIGSAILLLIPNILGALIGMVYHWFQPTKKRTSILERPPSLLDNVFGRLVRGFLYLPARVASYKTDLDISWDLEISPPSNVKAALKQATSIFGQLGMGGIIHPSPETKTYSLQQTSRHLRNIIIIREQQPPATPPSTTASLLQNSPRTTAVVAEKPVTANKITPVRPANLENAPSQPYLRRTPSPS